MKSQDNLKLKKAKSADSDKLEALYNEILKRDKIIEKLKEENVVLLRTSLKRSEELQEMKKLLEKVKEKRE